MVTIVCSSTARSGPAVCVQGSQLWLLTSAFPATGLARMVHAVRNGALPSLRLAEAAIDGLCVESMHWSCVKVGLISSGIKSNQLHRLGFPIL